MNHPKPEEWIAWLYEQPKNRRELDTHLRKCPECANLVRTWQQAQRELGSWKIPSPKRREGWRAASLRWAYGAAMILIAVCGGFLAGKATSPSVADLRAALEPDLRREIAARVGTELRADTERLISLTAQDTLEKSRKLLADHSLATESTRATELQQLYAVLLKLRRDVDTVAINADVGLRVTQEQLMQIVNYDSPVSGNGNDRNQPPSKVN